MPSYQVLDDADRERWKGSLGFEPIAVVRFDVAKYDVREYLGIFTEMVDWIQNCKGGVKEYASPCMFAFEDVDEALMFHLAFSHV